MSEETANSFYGRQMRCIAEAKRHAFVGKSSIRTGKRGFFLVFWVYRNLKLPIINTNSPSCYKASGNKFVLIVLNDGHASLLGYTVDGTHPRAVRYGVYQSRVKKFLYFFFDDVVDFWINPPLTLHLRRVVFFECVSTFESERLISMPKSDFTFINVDESVCGGWMSSEFGGFDILLLVVIALASPFRFGIVLLGRELEVDGIHISVVCYGVGFEFALRNRVLLWRCLKIRVLQWTVLIDSSLVGWTILIEIIALKMILVVVLLSRLMKSRWTHLIRNVLTVLNEISDRCGLKLLDVIVKYRKIIPPRVSGH
nr:hypothetical protein [Tanacetum cinerariifolium]